MSDVELATAMWVDWFNTERLHGSIDRLCPVEFENNWHAAQQALAQASANGDQNAA